MTNHTGYILSLLRGLASFEKSELTIDNLQQNGTYGVWQARLCLKGQPQTYRIILAPHDSPVEIAGTDAVRHFAKPLGVN